MGTTKVAKKVNKYFVLYASEHIEMISEDDKGLFCSIISESDEDKTYKVYIDESDVVPVAISCQCTGNADHNYCCKHIQAANLYWSRIYKNNTADNTTKYQQRLTEKASPVVASTSYTMSPALLSKLASLSEEETTTAETIVAPASRAQKWDKDLCCMIYVDTREIVDPIAHAAAIKAQNEAYERELAESKVVSINASALNNAPQNNAMPTWMAVLPSTQARLKQQEALTFLGILFAFLSHNFSWPCSMLACKADRHAMRVLYVSRITFPGRVCQFVFAKQRRMTVFLA